MIPAYAKAFFGERHTVFGLPLRPFSIGHSFLLEAIENPVAMGQPYSPQDAAVFAKVCSLPWVEALAFLKDWEAQSEAVQAWGASCAGMDIKAECAKVDAYFAEAMDCIPPRWEKDKDRSECKVPIQLAFFHILKGEQAITPDLEAQLWDTPFARAAIYAAAAGWAKGDDTLMTEKEVALVAELRQSQEAA